MKRYFLLSLVFITTVFNTFSEWEQSLTSRGYSCSAVIGNSLWLGRVNGITEYDNSTSEMRHYTMLNADLPSNRINELLKIAPDKYLLSTKGGLGILSKDGFTTKEHICTSYPDVDARNLYLDDLNRIWTFSANIVYYYENEVWNAIDLKEMVTNKFDISDIYINGDDVWVRFNDNSKSNTTYYPDNVIENHFQFALIRDLKLEDVFLKRPKLPYKPGDASIVAFGDYAYLKVMDSVYKFTDGQWEYAPEFNYNGVMPNWYQPLKKDNKGNIWYSVSSAEPRFAHLVMYNPATGVQTPQLNQENDTWISSFEIFEDSVIVARSSENIYTYKDNNWIIKNKSEFIAPGKNFINLMMLGNTIYTIAYGKIGVEEVQIVSTEDGSVLENFTTGFPYSDLRVVEMNKYGKGIFQGSAYGNGNYYSAQTDSGFEMIGFNFYASPFVIVTGTDGELYASGVRVENTNKPFSIAQFEGKDIKLLDIGYADKTVGRIASFDMVNNKIFTLGFYEIAKDSMNTFVSIYNVDNKNLVKFDTENSDLPDFYVKTSGYVITYLDTVPNAITVDYMENMWILTNKSLIKFDGSKSEIFDIFSDAQALNANDMMYDSYSNEIILYDKYNLNTQFSFNISNKVLTRIDNTTNGIKGKILKLKHLNDFNAWASDDLGYLYKYGGNGVFNVFDLEINGLSNLRFPINDFVIDFHRNLHLATEIGLLTNKAILSSVEDMNPTTKSNLFISPNPSSDFLTIQFQTSEASKTSDVSSVQIFDMLGIEIKDLTPALSKGEGVRIDVSKLPAGVYFIRLGDKVEKFVKM